MPTQHSGNLYCPLPEKKIVNRTASNESSATTSPLEMPTIANAAAAAPATATKREFNSTLIEFPKRKTDEAEWRDAVRERVRAVRERRDGGPSAPVETEKPKTVRAEVSKFKTEAATKAEVINLNPNIENRPTTRLIARALERVERSRQVHQSAATAVALAPIFEPQEMPAPRLQPVPKTGAFAQPTLVEAESKPKPAPRKIEMPFAHEIAVSDDLPRLETAPLNIETAVKQSEANKIENAIAAGGAAGKKEPRKLAMISDADADKFIESQMRVTAATPERKPSPRSGVAVEQEIAPRVREIESEQEVAEDYAPLGLRVTAGLLDIALCAGIAAALVALFAPTGYFTAERFGFSHVLTVFAVFAAVKFIYLTAAIVLAETTFAGRLFSLRTVHAEDGSAATVLEAALNSAGYLLTLAFGGIGLLWVLLSPERRAAHDLISGTVVIREN